MAERDYGKIYANLGHEALVEYEQAPVQDLGMEHLLRSIAWSLAAIAYRLTEKEE